MVNSLLDLERLESGKATLDRRYATLDELVAEADELLQIVTAEADQELVVEIERSLPPLFVDADMILRVIVNLVENAVKYTPDGGRIIVSAHSQPGAILVSVSDSGPGIPVDMREQVFDKYVRVKNKQVKGIGLGLAFCRLAVEAHGGRIWVESDPLTNGAQFSFTLPVESQLGGVSPRAR
jgi:signal transduction histidine kinase